MMLLLQPLGQSAGLIKIMKQGWEIKKIKDICDKASSNIAQNKITELNGDYPVFGASGFVQNVDFYHRDTEYIGIVKDGSGVGRVNTYPAYSSLLGTLQYIIPKEGYALNYVAYALKSLNLAEYASGAAIPHIYFKDYGEENIAVPSREEQERIVEELDCLSGIIEKKKQLLKELDALSESIFYSMFGDPITNEKGWEVKKLGEVANSVNYGTSSPATEGGYYTYIRMNNLTYSGYLDLNDVKKIDVSENEIEKCIVRKGDILFNRTNSKDLVGKTALFDLDEEMIIAGYIIRVRVNTDVVLPIYVVRYMNTPFMKTYFRNLCKGAVNQANINSKELKAIPILMPHIELQQEYAEKIEAIEKQKELIKQSITQTEELFNSRMDYYFN